MSVVVQGMEMSLVNGSILFQITNKRYGKKHIGMLEYRSSVAKQLVEIANSETAVAPQVPNRLSFEELQHRLPKMLPITATSGRLCPDETHELENRRLDKSQLHTPCHLVRQHLCVVHKQKKGTSYGCWTCRTALCIGTCFARFHNLVDFKWDDPEMKQA